ncbi:MAG: phospho-N-acetylmuramoyl-pentapeptide-transferase [Clostridiales bacterium]|nr:phospho-N-acetylmuramoyl-pentapeptide-transferase [Clostridiales bacterium]
MFAYLFPTKYWLLIGPLVTLILTAVALKRQSSKLPTDGGRAFAVDGASAKGKPTSAGIIFICVMFVGLGLFTKITWQYAIMYLCSLVAAVFGFLDDKNPWPAMKKAMTDIFISLGSAVLASFIFTRTIDIFMLGISFTIPRPLYIFLAACLVWGSINFTNASDGVDGLCGSMSMISTATFLFMAIMKARVTMMNNVMLYLLVVLGVYMWFNVHPSTLLMGDSGSQAIGVLLAFFAMASGNPFAYLIICLPLILDGGSSLFKLAVCRVTKKKFMSQIRTPLHDHCRKELGWANQKVTERFTLIHLLIVGVYVALLIIQPAA